MLHQKNYDFSFSGLKTAVLYLVKQLTQNGQKLKPGQKIKIAAETQQAIIDVLISKTLRAAKEYKAKTIILGGGVTANNELRQQFNHKLKTVNSSTMSSEPKGYKLNFLVPPKEYCTDNAVMVAIAAYFQWLKKKKGVKKIEANANLKL